MSSNGDREAELRALREDNDALRYSSQSFGELAERLTARVRELERRLDLYQRLWAERLHAERVKVTAASARVRSRASFR